MLNFRMVAISFCLFSLQACFTTAGAIDSVMKRAPFDLNCERSKISTTVLNDSVGGIRTIGAEGCGRRIVYIVDGLIAKVDSPNADTQGGK